MARLNVYVPDELAKAARAAGLNVSALTQAAIDRALAAAATNDWLNSLPRGNTTGVTHEQAMAALEEARDELGFS
ncbi:type II toxin-antitoxin system CcdA family antitoxin [Aeromicrobium sp.]|uniref:type II toxin-antitoxin system CcdA family antitoxin n=1 Tax=Aeromicrobium sp. TaxID=1871063 RepID=UPI003D6BE29E